MRNCVLDLHLPSGVLRRLCRNPMADPPELSKLVSCESTNPIIDNCKTSPPQTLGTFQRCAVQHDRFPSRDVTPQGRVLRSRNSSPANIAIRLLRSPLEQGRVRARRLDGVHSLRDIPAAEGSPLPNLQAMHSSDGSSLVSDVAMSLPRAFVHEYLM